MVLRPGRLFEPLLLGERIVELGVGVADLLGSDGSLESLAESRTRSVSLGKGGHDLGVTDWRTRREGRANERTQRTPTQLPSLHAVENSENVLETGLNYDVTNGTHLTKQAMET